MLYLGHIYLFQHAGCLGVFYTEDFSAAMVWLEQLPQPTDNTPVEVATGFKILFNPFVKNHPQWQIEETRRLHSCSGICLKSSDTGAILDLWRWFCLDSWLLSSHSIFSCWTLLHSLQTEMLLPSLFPMLFQAFLLLILAGKCLGPS